jgi:hypothetical protein
MPERERTGRAVQRGHCSTSLGSEDSASLRASPPREAREDEIFLF